MSRRKCPSEPDWIITVTFGFFPQTFVAYRRYSERANQKRVTSLDDPAQIGSRVSEKFGIHILKTIPF